MDLFKLAHKGENELTFWNKNLFFEMEALFVVLGILVSCFVFSIFHFSPTSPSVFQFSTPKSLFTAHAKKASQSSCTIFQQDEQNNTRRKRNFFKL